MDSSSSSDEDFNVQINERKPSESLSLKGIKAIKATSVIKKKAKSGKKDKKKKRYGRDDGRYSDISIKGTVLLTFQPTNFWTVLLIEIK